MTVDAPIEIHGDYDRRFQPVRDAFELNFTQNGEVGASVAVVVDGEMVVDLWAGHLDRERTKPWERDTIVNTWSTTKGMAATCAAILADRGLLDYDAPVTKYWPEFGEGSKGAMPVRYLLTHQAGLPVIDAPLADGAVADWETMIRALEQQTPVWEPGSAQGYHAVTFGHLVGEVIRRITGKSLGAFLRDEVTGPLGVDFFIGTPASEDHRTADLLRAEPAPGTGPGSLAAMRGGDSLAARALALGAVPLAPHANSREWREAEIPGGNGHGNAPALATVYGALARGGEINGTRLLEAPSVARAAEEQVAGPDEVLIMKTRRSLGFMLPVVEMGDRRGPLSFGHSGAGGSMGYADPEAKIGFGYVMNQMWSGGFMNPDPRAQSLAGAVYQSLRGD